MVGKTTPLFRLSAHAMHSMAPAAPSIWPVMDLVELTIAVLAFSSPNAFLMAIVSMESFKWVPVPWALI